jgi:hypothetical protein
MARVGRALVEAIASCAKSGPLKGWHPMDCPSEIVADLVNRLEEAQSRATPALPEEREPVLLVCGYCRVERPDQKAMRLHVIAAHDNGGSPVGDGERAEARQEEARIAAEWVASYNPAPSLPDEGAEKFRSLLYRLRDSQIAVDPDYVQVPLRYLADVLVAGHDLAPIPSPNGLREAAERGLECAIEYANELGGGPVFDNVMREIGRIEAALRASPNGGER